MEYVGARLFKRTSWLEGGVPRRGRYWVIRARDRQSAAARSSLIKRAQERPLHPYQMTVDRVQHLESYGLVELGPQLKTSIGGGILSGVQRGCAD